MKTMRKFLATLSAVVLLAVSAAVSLPVVSAETPQSALGIAAADTKNWFLEQNDAKASLTGGGLKIQIDERPGANAFAAYHGSFVKSGEAMQFVLNYGSKAADDAWTCLFFRSSTRSNAVPNLFANSRDNGYILWLDKTNAYIAMGVSDQKAVLQGLNLNDGKDHEISVTITDTEAGVRMDVTIDGKSFSWTDADNTYTDGEHVGFAMHENTGKGGYTLTLSGKEPEPVDPGEPEEPENPLPSGWAVTPGVTVSEDGTLTAPSVPQPGASAALYRGEYIRSGETLRYTVNLGERGANNGWTAFTFRMPNARTMAPGLWERDKGYSVWLDKNEARLCRQDNNDVMALENGFDFCDGKDHTLDVTMTDTAEGVKIEVVVDGKTLSWTDKDNTFTGEDHTGFAFWDCNDHADASYTVTLKPRAADPEPAKLTLAAAGADAEHWYVEDGAQVPTDGKLTLNGRTDVFAGYRGVFTESGKKMAFTVNYGDKGAAGWTALLFRVPNAEAGRVSLQDGKGYAIWLDKTNAHIAIGANAKVTMDGLHLNDGKDHAVEVTLTDSENGVVITLTIDGKTVTWTDKDNTFTGADNTGFAVHEYSEQNKAYTMTIADAAAEAPDAGSAFPMAAAAMALAAAAAAAVLVRRRQLGA